MSSVPAQQPISRFPRPLLSGRQTRRGGIEHALCALLLAV
jgi:hypothetical protein